MGRLNLQRHPIPRMIGSHNRPTPSTVIRHNRTSFNPHPIPLAGHVQRQACS
jgi:hypothetical protein